ncbi:MAG: type II secretion system protein [Candidatus Vogelbacteria bacterium]|nr:type II secretion system protein [Candidatus Vogelbacteria bacterium]
MRKDGFTLIELLVGQPPARLNLDIRNPRGFTLIELLVVIAIISLLSSIVLASLQTARVKARDSQRVQNIIQLRNALELYAADHDGLYPDYVGGTVEPNNRLSCWHICSNENVGQYYNADTLKELTDEGLISALPRDPKGPPAGYGNDLDMGYFYKVSESRRNYKLIFSGLIENPNDVPVSLRKHLFGSGFPQTHSVSICTEDACAWSENNQCGSLDDENPDTVPSMC